MLAARLTDIGNGASHDPNLLASLAGVRALEGFAVSW
jgi:hypothetical protein